MLSEQKRNGKISARGGLYRRAAAGALIALAGISAADALETDPPWRRPTFSRRIVFTPPTAPAATVLVESPAADFPPESTLAAFGPSGRPLGARVVFRNERRVWILAQREAPGETRPHEVYYGGREPEPDRPVRDPDPVRLEMWRPSGGNAPDTWPRMAYLLTNSAVIREPFRLPAFDRLDRLPADSRFPRGGADDRRRRAPLGLFRFASWALFPEDGAFRFVLDADATAFLFVDGQLAVSAPNGSATGDWIEGEPIPVAAGVRSIEVFVAARGIAPVRVGWRPPDAPLPEPLAEERLLTSARAESARFERMDRTLHPDFAATLEPPYSFTERPAFFQPVRLDHRTVNRLADNRPARWTFDDGGTAEGDTIRHVFARRGPWRVTLEARDQLGFVAAFEREVEASRAVPRLYPLHAVLVRLPAVVFPGDRVEPDLRIEGQAPAGARFVAEWSWTRRNGETNAETRGIAAEELPARFTIGRATAGEVESLRWSLRHEGIVLFTETIRFGGAPAAPPRIAGDALYDARDTRRVLRPTDRPVTPGQPPLDLDAIFGDVLFVDDTLAPPGVEPPDRDDAWHRRLARLLNGPDRPRVRLIAPPRPDRHPDAWTPLLKYGMNIREAMRRPTLVVLSIARSDLLDGMDLETFERHAAALTEYATTAAEAPAAWLTPPPFPDLPAARDYAAAIQRVARTRGIPVADLYTAFVGAGATTEPARFFHPGTTALTSEGRELAARTTARALLIAAGEAP